MKQTTIFSALIAATLGASGAAQAVQPQVGVNPGFGYYNFADEQNLEDSSFPSLGVEMRWPTGFAMEGTYTNSQTEADFNNTLDRDYEQYRLDGLYYFNQSRKLQPYLAAGAGEGVLDLGTVEVDETLVNAGVGMRYFFTPALSMRADARAFNSLDNEQTFGAATVGLSYMFGAGDAGSNRGDTIDLAVVDVDVDTDADGIMDESDQCPNTPTGVVVNTQGCPQDSDLDGIADASDVCSETPAGIAVDDQGCPLDIDQDSVADYLDRCPGTEPDLAVNDNGCPKRTFDTASIDLDVKFTTNSSQLTEDYFGELENLATFLKRYEDTVAVIEGHSDSLGNAEYNKALSQARAEAIRKLLVSEFGVDPERLKAIGYGEERPIAANDTPEGRKKNRRVVASVATQVEKFETRDGGKKPAK